MKIPKQLQGTEVKRFIGLVSPVISTGDDMYVSVKIRNFYNKPLNTETITEYFDEGICN